MSRPKEVQEALKELFDGFTSKENMDTLENYISYLEKAKEEIESVFLDDGK